MPVLALFEVTLLPSATPEQLERYLEYKAAVPPLVARFGGRYLARAATGEVLEGAPGADERRWHVIEFPDAASAHGFWACEEYRAIQPLRAGAVEVRAVLLDP